MTTWYSIWVSKVAGHYMISVYNPSPQCTHAVHTDPVIESCVDCGRPFRTFVPETYCDLPGGGICLLL